MIFYFSGTGNSAWAARQMARLTGDEACDITTLTQVPDLKACQQIGFCLSGICLGRTGGHGRLCKADAKDRGLCFRRLHLRQRGRACHEALFQMLPAPTAATAW